jgi:hypothetical protein
MEGDSKKKGWDFSKYYPLFFTVIFVFILFQYSFSTLEAIFYDLRIRFDLGIGHTNEVVLITMDEESDEFLGESYPYTYTSHYKLFEKLAKDQPLIVDYLVNLQEPETEAEMISLEAFRNQVKDYKSKGGELRFGTEMDAWGEQLPPKDLQEFGYSLALVNVDNAAFAKDDIVRRAILNISGENSLHLWTANRYRKKMGEEELAAKSIWGSYYVREADATFALFRYSSSPVESKSKIQKVPFHRVRVGNFPKGFFANKIVLIGPSYLSNASDYLLTPFNKEEYKSPKLVVHAQIIQALVKDKTIEQLPKIYSYALSVIIAIFLSITISRLNPTNGLMTTVIVMIGIMILSWALFCLMGLWIYVTHMILTVFVVYYIWVPFRAIGEYQRRFAIQEETKLIKRVENLKQNFISLMSHDLKTPVAKISGLADILLRQAKGNIAQEKNLHSIIDSTRELNNFITSILDLTKIESSNLNLNMVSKDINQIVESVIDGLKYEAASKNVKVERDLAPLYPIQFDLNLMKRVLSNLIENAIKYSGEGSRVDVKSWDDAKWVYIEIGDNGIGIPEQDLAHIFDKFYRVKNDQSHSIKGTGLGLYLVKYFVELHGGTISAISTMGQGTKFQVKLKNA